MKWCTEGHRDDVKSAVQLDNWFVGGSMYILGESQLSKAENDLCFGSQWEARECYLSF